MASCDIPAQVWALFSMAPNLPGLFWTPHRSPRPPYPVSLYLHLTNCTLSHNTLSAFNYCLEVSGLRVTHSTGSLRVQVCAVMSVRDCLDSMRSVSFVWRLEYWGKCWIPQHFFSPCSSRIAPPWPATTSAPQTCFRSANGLLGATGKRGECVGAVITSV